MKKYRKRPVVIEAVQWDGWDAYNISVFMDCHPTHKNGVIYIKTLEGTMEASKGDWIIKGVKGEFYPHKYPPLVSEWLFDKAQEIMSGHNKTPFKYAGKPILFRGLISCEHCGCTVSGYIKKKKYIYYSFNDSKKICKKTCVREEKLLEPLMEYLEKIQLPDALIEDIVSYLRQSF